MAVKQGHPAAGYTISLFISKNVAPRSEKDGYDTIEFPGESKELATVKLTGSDLEALLSDTKEHIDLVRHEEKYH